MSWVGLIGLDGGVHGSDFVLIWCDGEERSMMGSAMVVCVR